ncbi:MAG: response regulator transcription factor [Lautropia sp.]
MRIAIIEDDTSLARQLADSLASEGTTCHVYGDAKAFLHAISRESFDACIVDLVLPGMDGRSLVKLLRDRGHDVPVLVLTARDFEADVILSLEAGADDYLVKPARIGELRARLRALVRRASASDPNAENYHYDVFGFDLRMLSATIDGLPVDLTQKEFKLALLFMQNVGKPLSRGHIREVVWGRDSEIPSRTMDTHVSRVRSKLGLRPENGYLLAPVYSYGYRLENLKQNAPQPPSEAVA